MKYLWFLPAEYVPAVATLLVMFAGMAFVIQRKVAGISLLATAILLLVAPAFDPLIDTGVDTAFDLGEQAFHHFPWWLIVLCVVVLFLWLIRAGIEFFFDKETAQHATADILSKLILTGLRWMLYLAPLAILFGLAQYYL